MIGPIVLVCKWKANSSKELDGQPRAGSPEPTTSYSQFSRSLHQLVTTTIQRHSTTYIRISQHASINYNIVQLQVRYCSKLSNEILRNALLAMSTTEKQYTYEFRGDQERQRRRKVCKRERGKEELVRKQEQIYIYALF